ncbi:hypothetical protein F7C95_07155 [Opitutia bacterium ISCC 51]|nr:hypothetical protein F7C95_07155 [Opitutae bacterium ISCC 51]QXD30362.1 hypothetical protein GA003_07115 [Opitutae bacterium ISCC 52]
MSIPKQQAVDALIKLVRKSETSLNILGQAAWGMFLHLSTGQDTVMFGAPRACRKSNILDAESTVGLFVNTVPVIVKVDSSETVDEFTRRIQQNWVQLRDHENTPLPLGIIRHNLPKIWDKTIFLENRTKLLFWHIKQFFN